MQEFAASKQSLLRQDRPVSSIVDGCEARSRINGNRRLFECTGSLCVGQNVLFSSIPVGEGIEFAILEITENCPLLRYAT